MRYWLLCLTFALGACSRVPDTYAPPIQREPLAGRELRSLGSSVAMSDPMADAYIVRDVSRTTEGGQWRWAYQHPELRFFLDRVENRKFALDFSLPEITFKETGPITLTFRINGHPLDRVRFDRTGDHHYEKPVPASFLKPRADNFVAIETDKQWVSKVDGARLSFVLIRAGFVP